MAFRPLKLALVLALLAVPAHADRVSVMLGSKHIGATGFNEVNPGFFYTFENTVDLTLGAYYNSYGKGSFSVTVAKSFYENNGLQLQVFGGIATYPNAGRYVRAHLGNLVPIVGIQAIYGNTYLQLIPGDGKPVAGILAAGLTWKVN